MPDSTPEDQHPRQSKGIFLTDGVDLTLHGIRFSLDRDGPDLPPPRITLRQDLCRHWLWLGYQHAKAAQDSAVELQAVEQRGGGKALSVYLEREFNASMQATVSAAVALEAFHAAVKDRIDFPADQLEAWTRNRTAQWQRIAEVCRFAFKVKPDGTKHLRNYLREIFKYRNWAVHPPAVQREPVHHPAIRRGVEWRFVAFRAHNAVQFAWAAIGIVHQLTGKLDDDSPLGKYSRALQKAVDQLADIWIREFPDRPVTERQLKADDSG